jgi:hypothetical protein
MKSIASVHRFGDAVAVYVGDGNTTYLTAKQARALARALRDCAKSVVDVKFTNSEFGTRSIPYVSPEAYGAEVAKYPRNRKVPV